MHEATPGECTLWIEPTGKAIVHWIGCINAIKKDIFNNWYLKYSLQISLFLPKQNEMWYASVQFSPLYYTLFSWAAAANPEGPLPMTATFLPDLLEGGSGTTQPCSKPWSMMAFSMFLIVTGGSLIPSTQAPWGKNKCRLKILPVVNL